MVLSDKITLFQRAIEEVRSSDEAVMADVRTTVVHEVAHHFGIVNNVSLRETGCLGPRPRSSWYKSAAN